MTTQPRKDGEFIAWARNIDEECQSHQDTWQNPSDKLFTLNTLRNTADAAYQENANPEKSNRHTVSVKNDAFGKLRNFIHFFIGILMANDNISDGEIESMGLPPRKHHFNEPLPVPTDAPELKVVTGQHHDIDVYASEPQLGHPTEFLQTKGYHGLLLRYRKDGETEWHEEHTTRLHVTLYFGDEDEAKYLAVAAAWINPRLQHGPWSDEVKVLIN
jgi:hypothetical protein